MLSGSLCFHDAALGVGEAGTGGDAEPPHGEVAGQVLLVEGLDWPEQAEAETVWPLLFLQVTLRETVDDDLPQLDGHEGNEPEDQE
jgi:hypothetical protein